MTTEAVSGTRNWRVVNAVVEGLRREFEREYVGTHYNGMMNYSNGRHLDVELDINHVRYRISFAETPKTAEDMAGWFRIAACSYQTGAERVDRSEWIL